jgi:RNA 2',3'-cyclic 3'-phosphodiesterase
MPGSPVSHRLFLALTPPLPVRDAIAALRAPSRNVRWTPTDQLHITLRFLGETSVEATEVLLERLSEVYVEPFVLPIEGVGAFPQKGSPRVLWAGVGSGHPRLHQLRQQIDDLLLSIPGVDADLRTFHPHVTVGRCNDQAGSAVTAWLRTHREFAGPVFLVETFDLYASEHRPGGVEYRLVQSFPLAM